MGAMSLPTLPISFITALVSLLLMAMILRSGAGNQASRICFSLLFSVFCLQALLVGLRFGYGWQALAPLQRALPFAIGPLALLGFRALVEADGLKCRATLPHAIAAGLPMLIIWLTPLLVDPDNLPAIASHAADLLITLSFIVYLTFLLRLYQLGADGFEAVGFEGVEALRRWLLGTILLLTFMLILDSAIAIDFALSSGQRAARLIAIGSAVVIPILLAAALLYPKVARGCAPALELAGNGGRSSAISDSDEDLRVIEALDDLLSARGLHRDPDLTLSRLARRLGLPARNVSGAVNRVKGLNVSQFVNEHRIAYAAKALADSDETIAEVMLSAGFRTKSNFNREFKRVTGESPMDYRRRHRG